MPGWDHPGPTVTRCSTGSSPARDGHDVAAGGGRGAPPEEHVGRTAVELPLARLRDGERRPVHRVDVNPALVARDCGGAPRTPDADAPAGTATGTTTSTGAGRPARTRTRRPA